MVSLDQVPVTHGKKNTACPGLCRVLNHSADRDTEKFDSTATNRAGPAPYVKTMALRSTVWNRLSLYSNASLAAKFRPHPGF